MSSSKVYRTYGKRNSKQCESSKLFEDMLKNDDKQGPKACKAAAAVGLWGKQSFTSVRKSTSTPPPAKDSDPFSFESGGEDSPKKRKSPRKFGKSASDVGSSSNKASTKSAGKSKPYDRPGKAEEYTIPVTKTTSWSTKPKKFFTTSPIEQMSKQRTPDDDTECVPSPKKRIRLENNESKEMKDKTTESFDFMEDHKPPPVLKKAATSLNPPSVQSLKDNSNDNLKRSLSCSALKASEKKANRRIFSASPKKHKYKYCVWKPDEEDMASSELSDTGNLPNKETSAFDFEDDPVTVTSDREPRLKKVTSNIDFDNESSKLKVTREHKQVYTVVKEVRGAHECLEHGETDDFETDIAYILHSLSPKSSLNVRCLSATQLITKSCITAFRMHLRAHETLSKVLELLSDSADFPSLGLCTAALFFLLSRDRRKLELDRPWLELLNKLLVTKPDILNCKDYEKTLKKIKDSEDKLFSNTQSWVMDDLNASSLILESLLSWTNQNVKDEFKDCVRTSGGLEYVLNIVFDLIDKLEALEATQSSEKIVLFKKLAKIIKLVENLSYNREENQKFIVDFKNHQIIPAVANVLYTCLNTLSEGTTKNQSSVYSCLSSSLGMLMNITHNSQVSTQLCVQKQRIPDALFQCIFSSHSFLSRSQVFEVTVCSLSVILNICEHHEPNRKKIFTRRLSIAGNSMEFYDALIESFFEKEAAADKVVEEQDREREKATKLQTSPMETSGVWKDDENGLQWLPNAAQTTTKKKNKPIGRELDDEETNFTKCLKFADKHMEECVMAGFISLALGCMIQNDEHLQSVLRNRLPNNDFTPLIYMLNKLMGFLSLTTAANVSGLQSMAKISKMMQKCNGKND